MKSFRPNFNSITTRLILFCLAILLVSALVRTLLLSNYLRNDIVAMNSVQLQALASYAAQDIDHNIVERKNFLHRLASNFPLDYLDDPVRLRAWLRERHEIHPIFSQGLFVIDTSGITLTDFPVVAGRAGISCADRDYYRKAMQGQPSIGRPILGRASKMPVLPMSVPLRDKEGTVRAVLVGVSALNSTNFLDSLRNTRVGKEGGLILVSPQDELFVGASHRDLALKPTPPKGRHLQHDRAMEGFRGVGIDTNMGGIEELAAVVSVPSSGWFLVARMPTEEVFAPLSRLHRFMAANTGVLIFIFVVILIVGLRYLLGPLRHAAEHADRMTHGEIPLEPLPVVRRDEVGNLTQAFNRVLTKLLESRAEMAHLAHHDPLTGLPNRKMLADNMKQAYARAQRKGTRFTVLFMDMDGFKKINDTLGHDAGDEALREVASRLKKVVRSEDTLARVGGDEFVILLTDQDERARETAELVARKCLEVFRQPVEIKGQLCRSGVSIGIAVGSGESPPDTLLIAADQAMYKAKLVDAPAGKICWADEVAPCLLSM